MAAQATVFNPLSLMQILLADAKIMFDEVRTPPSGSPMFDAEANAIAADLCAMSPVRLAEILHCSMRVAGEAWQRYNNFHGAPRRAAITAFNGQAYKHLKAWELDADTLAYAQEHLHITGFLYGLLRPLDGIAPYRIEHHVSLPATGNVPVNKFWKDRLTDLLIRRTLADDGTLVYLSTAEYEQLFHWDKVCRHLRVIRPQFYVDKGSELKVSVVWAKACRGAMTRLLLKTRATDPAEIRGFCYEGFRFRPGGSDADAPLFVRTD